MSHALIRKEIERFLASDNPGVLCLTGKWGVGKTHLWREAIKQSSKQKDYLYVSLFGLRSGGEIWEAILGSKTPKEASKLITASPFLRRFVDPIPLIRLYIKDCIICFDDFERRLESLSVEEVFGIASYLKEEKNCKVVLILNKNHLGNDLKKYETHFEKIVDRHMVFSPTVEESFSIVRRATENAAIDFDYFENCCKSWGINNIRIIRKIHDSISSVWECVESYPERVKRQVIHSMTLFSWSRYGDGAPPISYLKNYNPFSLQQDAQRMNEDQETPEQRWENLLRTYQYTSFDELDSQILAGIEHGFFNLDAIRKEAEKASKSIGTADIEAAWAKFHESFDVNDQDVIDNIYQAHMNNLSALTLLNLNGAVTFLREMERDDLADKLIEVYCAQDPIPESVEGFSQYAFRREVTDPKLMDKIESIRRMAITARSPEEIFKKIAGGSWSEEDRLRLESLTAEDYYSLIKKIKDRNLHRIIRGLYDVARQSHELGSGSAMKDNLDAALTRIGSESALNRRRVRRHGIEVEDANQSAASNSVAPQ